MPSVFMPPSLPRMQSQSRNAGGMPSQGGGVFMPMGQRGYVGMEQHGTGDPDERPMPPLSALTRLGCSPCAARKAAASGMGGLRAFGEVNVDTADIADTANSYKWIAIVGGVVIMTILFYPEIKGLTSSFRR